MVCINVKKAFDTVNRDAFYIQDLIRFQFWTILHEKKLGTFLRPQHIKIANPLEKTSAKFNATNGGSPSTSCCFFCLPLLTSAWHLYKYCENVWPQSATLCPKRCFLIQNTKPAHYSTQHGRLKHTFSVFQLYITRGKRTPFARGASWVSLHLQTARKL